MTKKIALIIFNDRIAPVFDVACQALLVVIKADGVYEESLVSMPRDFAEAKVLKLVELGVTTIICGAISKPMLRLAQSYDIRSVDFIAGEVRQVLQAFLDNCLNMNEFRMPGCRRQSRCRNGQGYQRRGCFRKIRTGLAD